MSETTRIRVVRGDELGEEGSAWIARLYVEGFGDDLAFFSKDPERLTAALEHALVARHAHVALIDGEPAALAFLVQGERLCFEHDAAELRRHLGWYKGTIADLVFRSQFQKVMPDAGPGIGEIAFVASARRFRGRGAAKAVLEHILTLPGYREFRLEDISDVNESALGLYERVGFHEYRRRRVRHTRWSGINAYVSMRLVRE